MNPVSVFNEIVENAWRRRCEWRATLAAIVWLSVSSAWALEPADPVTEAALWTPQPEAVELRPGLAVSPTPMIVRSM